ncbi:MAG: crosslink repair DNA glycosylase YcaQ family protein, partial [Flavitalea sp.]
KDFFDFDYQVECFVPEPKRKYGYFSLPILAGETFIARMDSKADRKTKNLIIHNLHFEKINLTEVIADALIEAIREFAEFNSCYSVTITKSNNIVFKKRIQKELKSV